MSAVVSVMVIPPPSSGAKNTKGPDAGQMTMSPVAPNRPVNAGLAPAPTLSRDVAVVDSLRMKIPHSSTIEIVPVTFVVSTP